MQKPFTRANYFCVHKTFPRMHKIILQLQNFIEHACTKRICEYSHIKIREQDFSTMHTKGDIQLQAVKLFVNIILSAQNIKYYTLLLLQFTFVIPFFYISNSSYKCKPAFQLGFSLCRNQQPPRTLHSSI